MCVLVESALKFFLGLVVLFGEQASVLRLLGSAHVSRVALAPLHRAARLEHIAFLVERLEDRTRQRHVLFGRSNGVLELQELLGCLHGGLGAIQGHLGIFLPDRLHRFRLP